MGQHSGSVGLEHALVSHILISNGFPVCGGHLIQAHKVQPQQQ